MRKLPPERLLALLVAALIAVMGIGLWTMARSGPPRGQVYAWRHPAQR